MKEKSYIAMIGDVKGSRAVKDRSDLQLRLQGGLDRVNREHADVIAANLVLTVGDEFQGLLHSHEGLQVIQSALRASAFPQEVRFGFGIGPLDTPLRTHAIGMDGPCFHRARDAIQRAASDGTAVEVEVGRPEPAFDIYARLYSHIREGWTDRQRQVVDMSRSGMEGRHIAKQLEITPSAVSQRLTAAGVQAASDAEKSWINAMESYLRADAR
jgi:DNA-binding NarL/FixJ family response regulator